MAAAVGVGYAAERLLARRLSGAPSGAGGRERSSLPGARAHVVPTFDGGETYVVERGPLDARPIVLLHGLSLSSAAWHDQLVDLGDDFRVSAVDFRGHGRSTPGREAFKSLVDHDVREELAAVDVPALVVVGTHDVLTPPRMAKEIVRHLPHAELVALPGVGHMPMLEARSELHRVIADFASKLP